MKKLIIAILALSFLLTPSITQAAPKTKNFTFNVTRITTSALPQYKPVANSTTLFFSQCTSNIECDIYQKDLTTGAEELLVSKSGDEFPVAATDRYVFYNSYNYNDPTNKYEAFYFDLLLKQDVTVATGLENDIAQDADGNSLIFTIGDQVPDLYLYDFRRKTSTLIATQIVRPRISGNKIVWIEPASGGLVNSVVYDIKTKTKNYIADGADGYNSWPDVWQSIAVWQGLYDHPGIYYKNLKTGKQVKIAEIGDQPMIADKFITWVDYSVTSYGELWAYDLVSGKTLKLAENIKHDHAQSVFANKVFWTNILDNNIYQAEMLRQ